MIAEFALNAAVDRAEISELDVRRLRECLAQGIHELPESRQHRRFPIVAAVTLLPLSNELQIAGELRGAVAINVSAGGMAIVNARPIDEPFFAVDFSRASALLTPVVLEKLRTRTVGDAFEVAGKFVSRIEY